MFVTSDVTDVAIVWVIMFVTPVMANVPNVRDIRRDRCGFIRGPDVRDIRCDRCGYILSHDVRDTSHGQCGCILGNNVRDIRRDR